MNVLILGSSGLVGKNALEQALAHPYITRIVAPTRKPLAANSKLTNPLAEQLDSLLPAVADWGIDAVICALGTTSKKAGSKEAFRHVDYELPLAFAKQSHQAGAETMALISAIGASVNSSFDYAKTKGEVERDVAAVGFRSLTIFRPSIIGGEREESRFAEGIALRFASLMSPLLPKKFHVNPAVVIGYALVNSVVTAKPGCHFRYAETLN
jgi:uncharacterized protein YbjT (DUF2867 family)